MDGLRKGEILEGSAEFLVRGKKKVKFGLQKKEVLPYIVLVFLFIFKLQFFPKK